MKHQVALTVILFTGIVLVSPPARSLAAEQLPLISDPQAPAPAFPPSRACTKSSPCQNVTGDHQN